MIIFWVVSGQTRVYAGLGHAGLAGGQGFSLGVYIGDMRLGPGDMVPKLWAGDGNGLTLAGETMKLCAGLFLVDRYDGDLLGR